MMNLKSRREFATLINERRYKRAVEIGVNYGTYSKFLLQNSNLELLVSIDPWQPNRMMGSDYEQIFRIAQGELREFGDRSQIVQGSSPMAASLFEDDFFDFVYIDAIHDYEHVSADISAWWSKVAKGGVLAGHDYSRRTWPGVVRAVNEFAARNDLKVLITGFVDKIEGEPSWWIEK